MVLDKMPAIRNWDAIKKPDKVGHLKSGHIQILDPRCMWLIGRHHHHPPTPDGAPGQSPVVTPASQCLWRMPFNAWTFKGLSIGPLFQDFY